MTTAAKYLARFTFVIGAAVPAALFGVGGGAPASADPGAPPPGPGCATTMLPQVNCPPWIAFPPPPPAFGIPVAPEQPFTDPIITEHQIDDNLNQLLPDQVIIGEVPISPPVPLPPLPPGVFIVPGGGQH